MQSNFNFLFSFPASMAPFSCALNLDILMDLYCGNQADHYFGSPLMKRFLKLPLDFKSTEAYFHPNWATGFQYLDFQRIQNTRMLWLTWLGTAGLIPLECPLIILPSSSQTVFAVVGIKPTAWLTWGKYFAFELHLHPDPPPPLKYFKKRKKFLYKAKYVIHKNHSLFISHLTRYNEKTELVSFRRPLAFTYSPVFYPDLLTSLQSCFSTA